MLVSVLKSLTRIRQVENENPVACVTVDWILYKSTCSQIMKFPVEFSARVATVPASKLWSASTLHPGSPNECLNKTIRI